MEETVKGVVGDRRGERRFLKINIITSPFVQGPS